MKRHQQKRVAHVGLNPGRLPFGRLERAFAARWADICRPQSGINFGYGMLQDLMMVPRKDRGGWIGRLSWRHGFKPAFLVNQRDATIVATVIQWLGTNVGFAFLIECLREDGWQVTAVPGRKLPANETMLRRMPWAMKRSLPGLTRVARELKQIKPGAHDPDFYGRDVWAYRRHDGQVLYRLAGVNNPDMSACGLAKHLKQQEADRKVSGRMWT